MGIAAHEFGKAGCGGAVGPARRHLATLPGRDEAPTKAIDRGASGGARRWAATRVPMTGGRALILGATGHNFAAGMSGGIAYVLDEDGDFAKRLNPQALVDLEALGPDDVRYVQKALRKHFEYTRSGRADDILRKWDTFAPQFVKVFPREYKAALAAMAG